MLHTDALRFNLKIRICSLSRAAENGKYYFDIYNIACIAKLALLQDVLASSYLVAVY